MDHFTVELGRCSGAISLDTNVLLLYVVGSYDASRIPEFRATRKYNAALFSRLCTIVGRARTIVLSANVATETDNLLRQVNGRHLGGALSELSRFFNTASERYMAAGDLSKLAAFRALGISDASLLEMSVAGTLVIIDDLPLYLRINKAGGSVVNFSHYVS